MQKSSDIDYFSGPTLWTVSPTPVPTPKDGLTDNLLHARMKRLLSGDYQNRKKKLAMIAHSRAFQLLFREWEETN